MTSRRHLVGFTTLKCGLDRLMETEGEDGEFTIVGQARVALAGVFNSWVVETGDHRALPGFWTL